MDIFEAIIEGLALALEETGSWGAVILIVVLLMILLVGFHFLHRV
jgi:hypothetical protein